MRMVLLATLVCALGLRAQEKQIKVVPLEGTAITSGQAMLTPCHVRQSRWPSGCRA